MKLRLFASAKPVIGMIHVGALPGTPAGRLPLAKIIAAAVREAKIYREAGLDGVALENMHDVPYLRGAVGPEIVAAMTAARAGGESGISRRHGRPNSRRRQSRGPGGRARGVAGLGAGGGFRLCARRGRGFHQFRRGGIAALPPADWRGENPGLGRHQKEARRPRPHRRRFPGRNRRRRRVHARGRRSSSPAPRPASRRPARMSSKRRPTRGCPSCSVPAWTLTNIGQFLAGGRWLYHRLDFQAGRALAKPCGPGPRAGFHEKSAVVTVTGVPASFYLGSPSGVTNWPRMISSEAGNKPDAGTGLDAWFTPGRFAALLAILIAACFPQVISGLETFFYRDYCLFGYPLAVVPSRILLAG